MAPFVKICGLSSAPALDAALDAGADMVGFVVFPRSPRHVALDQGAALASRVSGRARTVVLTVDADDVLLASIVAAFAPDLLQLHGVETPARVARVRARFGLPVIKAVGLAGPDDMRRADAYRPVADHLLFDAKAPPEATRPGGNGARFDWALLRRLQGTTPWLLAGGLTPDNAGAAVGLTGAPGLDVSSGVEHRPGVKDPAKIRAFLAAAKGAARVGSADARV